MAGNRSGLCGLLLMAALVAPFPARAVSTDVEYQLPGVASAEVEDHPSEADPLLRLGFEVAKELHDAAEMPPVRSLEELEQLAKDMLRLEFTEKYLGRKWACEPETYTFSLGGFSR